jgi:tetratricopeptide (TPR) repeat protein
MPYPSASRLLLAAAVLLAGCAQSRTAKHSDHAPAAAQATPAPFRALADAADRQRSSPVAGSLTAEPPPGLEPRLVEPVGDSPESRQPLEEVIPRLALKTEVAPAVNRPSPADQATALHLYASGREKLARGQTIDAVNEFKKAIELDPVSGEPWRELAEAQMAAGWRTDAMASFEQAVNHGLEDPRVLERLGRAASDRGDNASAAAFLSRASLASPERNDPLLAPVIDAALSRALAAKGYTAASRDALLRAVQRSPAVTASTRYGEEYGAIFRRQGELWRDVGDASCRLGEYEHAAAAYDRADDLPMLDSRGLLARRVYAEARCGRPAGAALAVLENLAARDGRIDDETSSLLAYTAALTGNSSRISEALTQYEASLAPPVAPSIGRSLARARAAVQPTHARSILESLVARDPWDVRTVTASLDAAPDESLAVAAALNLVARHPRAADRIAQALISTRFQPDTVLAALARARPADVRALTLAQLELLRGHPSLAADVVAPDGPPGPLAPAYALTRLEAGFSAGRAGLVDAATATLLPSRGAEWAPYRVRALAAYQRNAEALTEASAVVSTPAADPATRIEDLLVAAELAITLGQGDDAERYLRDAASIDPYDERPPMRQLTLYGPGGPKAESAKLSQVIRETRRLIPESRTLRAAHVKELLRRSLLDQAEDGARRLADEDPGDPASVDLLVSVYKASATRDGKGNYTRAKEWLQNQLQRRPAAPSLLAGLTQVLVATGEQDEAQSMLRAALREGGGPDVSRILEGLLRTDLHRPQEAETLALARLEGRPRLAAESIELAECYARSSDDAKAAATVVQAFPAGVTILPDQAGRIMLLTALISQHAAQKSDLPAHNAALTLFDFAIDRSMRLTPDMHQRRFDLLAAEPDISSDRMQQAAAYMAQQYPTLNDKPYIAASQSLSGVGRGAIALVLISRLAEQDPHPSTDLLGEWTRLIATVGTAAHARVMIERAQATSSLTALVARFQERGDPAPGNPRAEMAYRIGGLFSLGNRPDEANKAYELTLEYAPDHPWACNNLGYSLLERGGDLARASELLERAHAALPDAFQITDSLGWLRYKQGVIDDEHDAAGAVSKRGAASLLQEAAMSDGGRNDPTILDHVGDALWLTGRAEEAARYWQLGEQISARLLGQAGQDRLTPGAAAEMRTIRDTARTKRRAAESGQTVKVAPQISNPDPQPPARSQTEPPAPASAEPGPTIQH